MNGYWSSNQIEAHPWSSNLVLNSTDSPPAAGFFQHAHVPLNTGQLDRQSPTRRAAQADSWARNTSSARTGTAATLERRVEIYWYQELKGKAMKPITSDEAYERAKRELAEQGSQGPSSVVDLLLADIGSDNSAPTSAPKSPRVRSPIL